MWGFLRSHRTAAGFLPAASLLVITSVSGFCQAPAAAAPADKPSCSPIGEQFVPLGSTIQAKATGGLSAAHMKAGKKFWVNVSRGVAFPSCTMENDAAIYGEVVEASTVKSPPSAELAVKFDHVDCSGKGKKEMTFWLVGVVAPPDSSRHMHDEMPTEVRGGARSISDEAHATDAYDPLLSKGGPPNTVRVGAVVGYNGLKLEPQGGPSCSAKLTSDAKDIQFTPGTTLLLAVRDGE